MNDQRNWPSDIGVVLRRLREKGERTQADIAAKLNVDQSRVSRIENGDITPAPGEVAAFLKAVKTQAAEEYSQYLNQTWSHLEPPEFGHSELAALGKAESCLQQLEELLSSGPSSAVALQVGMHREALTKAATYLMDLRHRIAFIGQIGEGRSTAISMMFNLLVPSDDSKPALERTILPRGTGRITICEEGIATEPHKCAIVIEPEAEEEVIRIVSDMCADAWKRTHDSEEKGTSGRIITAEVERAIRNMTRLGPEPRRRKDKDLPDPLDELARDSSSRELLCAEVFGRLNLWRRTRTRLEGPRPDAGAGWQVWLRDTLKEVNYGLRDDVSLPRRISVIVPFTLLPKVPYIVSVTDTKGIDRADYAVRPDLMNCMDDDRTIIVLCSPFSTVPDIPSQQLLTHIVETRPEHLGNCVLLGLAKFGEALQTTTDSGDPVEDKHEAYGIKGEQVRRELQKLNLPDLPREFFDAISDDPAPVTDFLGQQIAKRRAAVSERIDQIEAAIQQLVRSHADIRRLECLAEVRQRLIEYLNQHSSFPVAVMPPYEELLDSISRTHQRTVWASTRRNGSWYGLEAYFHLGEGVLIDARKRCSRDLTELDTLINGMMAEDSLEPIQDFLSELQRSCESWKAQFFESVKLSGKAAFLSSLKEDDQVWNACRDEYGRGRPGYRDSVAGHLRRWFERQETASLLELLEEKVREAWCKCFTDNLKKVAASLPPEAAGVGTTTGIAAA